MGIVGVVITVSIVVVVIIMAFYITLCTIKVCRNRR